MGDAMADSFTTRSRSSALSPAASESASPVKEGKGETLRTDSAVGTHELFCSQRHPGLQ